MRDFVHLHNHTEYSLLDGMSKPDEVARIAAEYGQRAISMTDHGTMGGYIRFQEACAKYGIDPIFGLEAYFTESIADDKENKQQNRFHLIMLAKNDDGMRNLYKLSRSSWTTGFYYKNLIDWHDLTPEVGRGIVATSSCMGGVIAKFIREGKEDEAIQRTMRMVDIFEDFYIELQPWNDRELNLSLLSIAEAYDIPIIGAIDCHYPSLAEKDVEEVLLCVGTWPSLKASQTDFIKKNYIGAKGIRDIKGKLDYLLPDRNLTFHEHDLCILNGDEVYDRFRQNFTIDEKVLTTLMDTTLEVADKCKGARIPMQQKLLPVYDKKHDSYAFLEDLAQFKMGEQKLTDPVYVERLEEELAVIKQLDFADYFLVIWDLVNWAKRNNIYVGAGRGSAAGSLLSYVLEITDCDPIEHGLIFWRFINPDRLDYPDIDLDFEDRRRNDVKEYLKERWGIENVAGISTYGVFQAKVVVKDISRIFGCPVDDQNKATKHFSSIEEYLEGKGEGLVSFRAKWPEVGPLAEKVSGRIRQAGAHAAGMVVSNRPLHEVAPIETRNDPNSDGRIEVVAYDMDDAAKLGLIKIDVLGLNTLSVVHDTVDAVRERYGIDISKTSQTLDDSRVFEEFSNANTVGVFQTESSAYKHLLQQMGIDNFNDLAASNALVRPGAMETQTGTYIERKLGRQRTTYLHPILEPITSETYGTFIYQEQIMETAVKLAGFNWRQSDTLRKIIGKKKDIKEFEEWRVRFVEGASRHISTRDAEKMFDDFERFSGYAFNKSHAIAYSKLSYQTMWLKIHYPVEFMWALLKNEHDKQFIATYLLECIRIGLDIRLPHVNHSGEEFTLEGDSIRFGFRNIKGIGEAAYKELMTKRPFTSLDHLRETTKKMCVKVGTIEALEKVGALEGIHSTTYDKNRYLFEFLNYPLDLMKPQPFDDKVIPCDAFVQDSDTVGIVKAIIRSTKRMPNYFRVEFEDMTGSFSAFANREAVIDPGDFIVAFVKGNSIYDYMDIYNMDVDSPFYNFLMAEGIPDEEEIRSYGAGTIREPIEAKALVQIVGVKPFRTKAGKTMCTIMVWDTESYQEVVLFPTQYGKYVTRLKAGAVMLMKPDYYQNSLTIHRENGMLDAASFLALKRLGSNR